MIVAIAACSDAAWTLGSVMVPRGFALPMAATLAGFAQPVMGEENPVRTILFGSMDAGPSAFMTTGAKIALDDVNREGFAMLVSVGTGARLERGPAAPGYVAPTLVRTTLLGSALAGYQVFRDWGVAAVFAGPEGSVEALAGGGTMVLEPARFGLRLQGELWARPSADTLVTATVIAGSSRTDLYGRFSAGYRLWDAYLGPEAGGYGDATGYRKWSLGLHATDFALGGFSFRVSAGALYESGTRQIGPYFALATWAPL